MQARLFPLALFALLLVAAGCNQKQNPEAQLKALRKQRSELTAQIQQLEKQVGDSSAAQEAKPVVLRRLKRDTFRHFVSMQGSLESEDNIQVNPKMNGRVEKVYVNEGATVRRGQVLARLNDDMFRKQLDEARTALELADTMYTKQKRLRKRGVGTEVQYLEAKNKKERLEKQIASLKSQLNNTRITSPISGVVEAVNVKEGESAIPGRGAFQVVNDRDMKVAIDVPDTYINRIDRQTPVKVEFPDLGETVEGEISFVGQSINPMSRTFKVEVAVKNKHHQFRPNMLAIVHLNDQVLPDVITLDYNLVQRDEDGERVFVKGQAQGRTVAQARPIKTGNFYDGEVVVEKGLKAGDEVIAIGYQDLVEGMPIRPKGQKVAARR